MRVVVLTSVPVCGWRSPLTREREQLEYTLDIETKKLQRTQRALERSNEENSQLRADLRMLKANSHRTVAETCFTDDPSFFLHVNGR